MINRDAITAVRGSSMILVTGANGFVGRHVVRRLAADGQHVRALVRRPEGFAAPGGVDVVAGDVTQPPTLTAALEGVSKVVHAAAITGNHKEPYRGAYRDVHEVGTTNLMDAARGAGVGRVVLVSGLGTVPAAEGTYMATRWAMEEAVRNSGIPWVIIQPSVQFGDDAEFIAALARLARISPVVPAISSSHDLFQPIWVEDVVTIVEKALGDDTLLRRAIAVGGPDHLKFAQILHAIIETMGKKRLVAPLPIGIARVQAALMSFLPKPPLTSATLELFGFENTTDLDAVQQNFGFAPRGLREHLRQNGLAG
ncbi:MAG: NAD(P)H-binding protein [Candidatus Dormibacteria bacterium]